MSKFIRKIFLFYFLILLTQNASFANSDEGLRSMFLNNKSNILGINIRNFNSADTNENGFIDENEEKGNFINAIKRLDEVKSLGINTLHVLPVTPVGKLKALGTAGSLYAISDFSDINPQLADINNPLSPKEQLKLFINECHKRGIKVIIDLPSCGSYDLFLKHPELFIKDDKNCSIVPSDWTDVRLFNVGTNEKLNQDVKNAHTEFADMIIELGADGIRADVATIKPYRFWEEFITYVRSKSPEFLFLAEASDSWREPPSKYADFTPYDELLKAGFDGYYGSFFNLKEWKNSDLYEHIRFNQKLLNSYNEQKSVIMSFTTHDELSPIVLHGTEYSVMIAWLMAVLPYNPYSIDGFYSGDDYIYPLSNTKADFTQTDDDYYFVHRGKLDIFNFSRKPDGKKPTVLENYKNAMNFRKQNEDIIIKGEFIPLKTDDENVFAFIRSLDKEKILVLGNLDFNSSKNKIVIKDSSFNKKIKYEFIKGNKNIQFGRKKITVNLMPGEINVIKISK